MSYSLVEAKPLQELCKVIDCEHKTAPYVEKSEFLVVRTSNVRNGQLLMEDMKYTTLEGFNEWTQRAIPEYGDVLFTREAPAGESCLVPNNKRVCIGQRMVLLRPNTKKIDSLFLSFILATEKCKFDILRLSIGSTVSRINIADIKKLRVAAPPIVEQKKIAQILYTWDKAIATTEKLLENSQKQKQALMQQLLTGKKRFSEFSGEWKTLLIGEITEIQSGTSKTHLIYENGIRYILDMGSVSREGKLIPSKKTNSNADLLKQGQLIMPKDDIGGGNIIGRVGYVPEDNKFILSDHVYALTVKNQDSLFISYLINSDLVNKSLRRKANGTAQLGLGKKDVSKQKIKLPPTMDEQQKIASVLNIADKEILAIQTRLDLLKEEKKSMMQQLLTGKRRVKVEH